MKKLIILALLLVCSCNREKPAPAKTTLKGQISITLKNRETVKLPESPIFVVDANIAQNTLDAWLNESRQQLAKTKEFDELTTLLKLMNRNIQLLNDLNNMDANSLDMANKVQARKDAIVLRKREIYDIENKLSKLSPITKVDLLPIQQHIWKSICLSESVSDADGNFSIAYQHSNAVSVISWGTPKLFNDEDNHFWIVPPNANTASKLYLNESNCYDFQSIRYTSQSR